MQFFWASFSGDYAETFECFRLFGYISFFAFQIYPPSPMITLHFYM